MRLLFLILLGAGALAVAWLSIAAGLVASFSPQLPLAAAILPDHPAIVQRLAAAQYAAGGGSLDRAASDRAVRSLAAAPLAAEPFFAAALAVRPGADDARRLRLLEEARRRNPRYRLARLLLIDQYLRGGRVRDATQEIAVVTRLVSSASELLVPQLARLASNPETRDAVAQALAADPLLDAVLEQLAQAGGDPALVLRLARGRPRSAAGAAPPNWQGLLIDNLVTHGRIEEAHRLWLGFGGIAPAPRRDAVYDPEFRGLPGTPPFNWLLREDEQGVAERAREGALMVDYFGRAPVELASQLLQLPPGRYRLTFQAEGEANGQGSRLLWQVRCSAAQARLAEIAIEGVTAAPRRLGGEFTVPATGCGAQWLLLEGVSAEFPTTQSARISALSLRPAGSRP